MRQVRLIARLGAILAITLTLGLLRLAAAPLRWLSGEAERQLRCALLRCWGHCLCRVMGVRARVTGKAPRAPCLLVCNHLGYLDIPLLAARAPAVFVARADLAHWPLVGLLARSAGTVFVDRSRRRAVVAANAGIRAAVARGDRVILFPEGTSSAGTAVLPFMPSLLAVAAETGLAVHYATLVYRTPPGEAPPGDVVCWWGNHEFLPHLLRLLQLRWIDAQLHFADEPVGPAPRKQLASALHAAISRQHGIDSTVEVGPTLTLPCATDAQACPLTPPRAGSVSSPCGQAEATAGGAVRPASPRLLSVAGTGNKDFP